MNQCMGCQSGWPVRYSKIGGYTVHEVADGYPGEIVACTANRYVVFHRTPGETVVFHRCPNCGAHDVEPFDPGPFAIGLDLSTVYHCVPCGHVWEDRP